MTAEYIEIHPPTWDYEAAFQWWRDARYEMAMIWIDGHREYGGMRSNDGVHWYTSGGRPWVTDMFLDANGNL